MPKLRNTARKCRSRSTERATEDLRPALRSSKSSSTGCSPVLKSGHGHDKVRPKDKRLPDSPGEPKGETISEIRSQIDVPSDLWPLQSTQAIATQPLHAWSAIYDMDELSSISSGSFTSLQELEDAHIVRHLVPSPSRQLKELEKGSPSNNNHFMVCYDEEDYQEVELKRSPQSQSQPHHPVCSPVKTSTLVKSKYDYSIPTLISVADAEALEVEKYQRQQLQQQLLLTLQNETSELLTLTTPVKSWRRRLSPEGLNKIFNSPVYVTVDLESDEEEEVASSEDECRYKLRPRRKLYKRKFTLHRYHSDSEPDDSDQEEVMFMVDEDDDDDEDEEDDDEFEDFLEEEEERRPSGRRYKSSYVKRAFRTGEPKGLSVITNCPISVKWLVENFEYHHGKSLPRGFVYDQYVVLCSDNGLDPVNAASFGKLIRSVFPGLKTRRLGTRGNSKYHYNGVFLKSSSKLLSMLNLVRAQQGIVYDNTGKRGRRIRKILETEEDKRVMGSRGFDEGGTKNYLGKKPDVEMLFKELEIDKTGLPETVDSEDITSFEAMYFEHCTTLLTSFESFDIKGFLEEWKKFWRIQQTEAKKPTDEEVPLNRYQETLKKATLFKVCSLEATQDFIRKVDLTTYQLAIDILFPCMFKLMPVTMVQAMRNFVNDVEPFLIKSLNGFPTQMVLVKLKCLRVFIIMWNELSKLNRMEAAVEQIIRCEDSVNVIKSELNRALNLQIMQEELDSIQNPEPRSWASMNKFVIELQFRLDHPDQSMESWVLWVEKIGHRASHCYNLRRKPSILRCWKFSSDSILGAVTRENSACFGVFKTLLSWCDNLISHVVAVDLMKFKGFAFPIFYYENKMQISGLQLLREVAEKVKIREQMKAQCHHNKNSQSVVKLKGGPRMRKRKSKTDLIKPKSEVDNMNKNENEEVDLNNNDALNANNEEGATTHYILDGYNLEELVASSDVQVREMDPYRADGVMMLDYDLMTELELLEILEGGDDNFEIII